MSHITGRNILVNNHISKKILLVAFINLILTSGWSQDSLTIQKYFDQFYDNEFTDLQYAKTQLDSGIRIANNVENGHFIALGHKYKSFYYEDIFEIDSAIHEIRISREGFIKLGNQKEVANCYNLEGNLLSEVSKMEEALIAYEKGLELAKKIDDWEEESNILNNLGVTYSDLGNYVKSVDYYWESLKLCEQNGDELGVSDCWNNLGSLYSEMGDYEQALEFHNNSLEIRKNYDIPSKKSSVYLNIGRIYSDQGKFIEARDYFKKSVDIDKQLEDFDGSAIGYNNIGLTFFREGQSDSALKYYKLSLTDRQKTQNLYGYSLIYTNLGDYYLSVKDYKNAEFYCKKSYQISKELSFLYELNFACDCLYRTYRKQGNKSLALNYLEEYSATSDSIRAESKTREVTKKQMEYQFYSQSLKDSLVREKDLHQRELEHQLELNEQIHEKEKADQSKSSQLKIFIIIALALIINFIVIYYRYKGQKKQRLQIEEQKVIIEEKSHDIQQSIDYAKLIQSASLPEKQLNSIFPDSFILYKPKDVVSGDFYWLEDNEQYSLFSVADCTGHGIPGAFISLIGTILLNEIFNSKKLYSPNKILNELNRLIQLTLNQAGQVTIKDGMDISFCCWDKINNKLYFSGANNPVWVISSSTTLKGASNDTTLEHSPNISSETGNGKHLFEVRADRQPVGKMYTDSQPFTLHELDLQSGDMVYLFSDGYPDQFGGEKGKKYKHKNMKKLFLQIADQSMINQNIQIDKEFEAWKNDFEQIDDVCVIGVRI